jgi:hypothetical protein
VDENLSVRRRREARGRNQMRSGSAPSWLQRKQRDADPRRTQNNFRKSSRSGLANVAALTRESPSGARVSSVFNAQLGGAYPRSLPRDSVGRNGPVDET